MNSQPVKHFVLFFDGATADGNPGTGGCAAVCFDKDSRDDEDEEPIFCERRTLGTVTSNAAEYYGLITGLRRLLYEYPITEFDVTVRGDSEVVIEQMKGEYEVRSKKLLPLHIVAKGLVKRVRGEVKFKHIDRDRNKLADKAAKKAAKTPAQKRTGQYLIFHPNRMGLQQAAMDCKDGSKKKLIIGNDAGTAGYSPESLFDATTILETMGKGALQRLLDPGKTTQVRGQVDLTVLGILSKPVTVYAKSERGDVEVTIEGGVVVDSLPWDFNVSVHNPKVRESGFLGAIDFSRKRKRFDGSSVPSRFQGHPFWHTDTRFLPI